MNYKEFVNDNGLVVDWIVSNVCNFNCSYCASMSKNGSESWPDIELTRKTVQRLVERNKNKTITYVLSGGELTIWKRFIDFVLMLREETPNCVIKLISNGAMPKDYWKKYGKLFDRIQFSFHIEEMNLDRFISSVNECSCDIKAVFVMAKPSQFNEVKQAYHRIVNECTTVNMTLAKPMDTRYSSEGLRLEQYTQDHLDWINNSQVLRNVENIKLPKYIGITEDGSQEIIEPLKLIADGKNHWRGWQCNVGVEKITFRVNGDITRGSSCSVGGVLGNWRTGEIADFDIQPVICPLQSCFCGADLMVSRKRLT